MLDFNHIPVLPREVLDAFPRVQSGAGGIYVDGTLGGGGHSGLILERLPAGSRLIGIDRDEHAINAAINRLSNPAFQAVRGNFHDMPEILQGLNIPLVDGILLDLGVSSHQLDTPERGFSYRFDGLLDMRMDNRTSLTAAGIVNTYSERELADLIFAYGEDKFGRRIARAICTARVGKPIETTLELASIIEKATPRQKYGESHPAMRTFQAIRIAVNDELSPLKDVLTNIVGCLKPGGRIAVITFHSLEDRIVKTTFQKIANPCECPRDIPYCVCGKTPGLKIITKKPIVPTQDELKNNKRSHSAKLRVAERI